jgi:outer membrane protein insertion porin family
MPILSQQILARLLLRTAGGWKVVAADDSAKFRPVPLCSHPLSASPRTPSSRASSAAPGRPLRPATVERDFNSLWNTGYFENVRIERVDTPPASSLSSTSARSRPSATIDYKGLNAVTLSDVEERFKKAKVGLTVESQYDPTRIKRAEMS